MSEWNMDAIRHALSTARERGFAEVELEASGTSFQAKLASATPRAPQQVGEGALDLMEQTHSGEITATLVGYYQLSEPPLQVGRQVQKGDIVAVITALGLANDVESQVSGEVTAVLVQPGSSVQYGQPLAQVRLNP